MAMTITVSEAYGADYSGDAAPGMVISGTINLGNPYATGGIAITAAAMNTALATAGYTAEISTIDRMVFSESHGSGASKINMKYDSANSKVEAYTSTNTLGVAGTLGTASSLGTASVPGALAVVTETGLSPSSHVVTPAGTPLVFLRGQITAGGSTGALNLQDAAPANSLDGHVTAAAGLDTTVTCLAADAATAVTLTFLTWTAGTASVPTTVNVPTTVTTAGTANSAELGAIDVSGADYTCEFMAVCSK